MKTLQFLLWLSATPSAHVLPRKDTSSTSVSDPSTTVSETESPSTSAMPSANCPVSASSPSIAPMRVSKQSLIEPSYPQENSPDVWISPDNSTTFEFAVSHDFPQGSTCALQFRMPFCSELPQGYPCYRFSGLEHEILAGAGLSFSMAHSDASSRWDDDRVHQLFPGDKTIIGTFRCDFLKTLRSDETSLSWISHSVSGFQLDFMQAGIGKDAKFDDGVGAWIVQCEN